MDETKTTLDPADDNFYANRIYQFSEKIENDLIELIIFLRNNKEYMSKRQKDHVWIALKTIRNSFPMFAEVRIEMLRESFANHFEE